ncbi:MAG: hypothetical protein NTV29_05900 [Planctomycetota bacterium]|nr:hypothetical protein [Planctomycetota bacterium]
MESQRIEIPKSASAPNDVTSQPGTSPEKSAPEKSASRTPESAPTVTSIESRLKAWVKSVEKDTQTQVQDYLEQIDAGQSGE